jgi:class 3 adenylate cyclase
VSWSTTLKNRQLIRARVEADEPIAVMFSDIRGFTAYTAREGNRAAYHLSQAHESLLKERIESRGGILVKTLGDGVMAAFAEPDQGVRAAVTVQQAIRARNHEAPREPIDVGIGLASGTPVMTESDMIGHVVNLSQRVSSLAKGGQILVTESIKSEASILEGMHYLPVGRQKLKGLEAEPLYEVVWMGEVARVSDAEDALTLVLTERGTLVVELSKDIQSRVDEALEKLQDTQTNAEGAFSAFLQRTIARFTQGIIDKSLNAAGITREQPLDRVEIDLEGVHPQVRIGKKVLNLRGADPGEVRRFQERLVDLKAKLKSGKSELKSDFKSRIKQDRDD